MYVLYDLESFYLKNGMPFESTWHCSVETYDFVLMNYLVFEGNCLKAA